MQLNILLLIIALATGTFAGGPAVAAVNDVQPESVTVDVVNERLAALETDAGLGDEQRESLTQIYLRARESLIAGETAMANATALSTAAADAERAVRELELAIAATARDNDPATIRQRLARNGAAPAEALVEAQIEFNARRATLTGLEQRMVDMRSAPLRIRDDIATVKRSISKFETSLDALDNARVPTASQSAEKLLANARLQAANARLTSFRAELSTLEPRTRILAKEIELATAKQAHAAAVLEAARTIVGESTQEKAAVGRDYVKQFQATIETASPAVAEAVRRNAELAAELVDTLERTQKTAARQAASEQQLAELEDHFAATRKRVDIAGTNPALAILLREERQRLPDARTLTRRMRSRITDINAISFRQIEIADELRIGAETQTARLRTALIEAGGADTGELHSRARDVVDSRRELLTKLGSAYSAFLKILSELDFSESRTLEVLQAYQTYLDERLLWLPSAGIFTPDSLRKMLSATTWLASIDNWRNTFNVLRVDVVTHIPAVVMVVIALAAYAGMRGRLSRAVDELGALTKRARTDLFRYSIYAIAIILFRAGILPLILYATGWRLEIADSSSDFAAAVGAALKAITPFVFVTYFVHRMTRPAGIASTHFHWDEHARNVLYRNLTIVLYTIPAIFFFYVVLDRQPNPEYRESLGRLLLIVATIGSAFILQRLLHPSRGIPAEYLGSGENGLGSGLKYVWFWLLVAFPPGLAIAAAAGYQYAANVLFVRFLATIGVGLAARFLFDLGVRWIAVVRRRLRYKIALENQATSRDGGETESSAVPEVDLMEVDTNSRQLIRVIVVALGLVGIWLLWRDILPALDALSSVDLWHYTRVGESGNATFAVSLQDLLVAAGLTILFTLGARDIPTVLQIGVLQRLSIDPGSRYAIRALLQYVIVGIGVAMVFAQLGFAWSQVQWLVAALGVGLGFGLQEIFANFISGIILLFERPIRVGDLVSVDDVTGTIDRIQIRATTLTDFDRKEVIVPNKTFLTSRVVNWTLTDAVTRVVIPVGISYGDDTEAARKIILDIAQQHPLVLEKPEPRVYFRALGDSSLNFELWVYVYALTDRIPVTDDILMQVERALPRAGITIPFPQRDLHVEWPGTMQAPPDDK